MGGIQELPDIVEKVRSKERGFEKIISYIPGYRGYKEKEIRRESDRLVRRQAVASLKKASDAFRRSLSSGPDLPRNKRDAADRLISRMDLTRERIGKAVGGYSGFFDAVKVREDRLDRMIAADLDLMNLSSNLAEQVEKVSKAGSASSGWSQEVSDAEGQVEKIEDALRKRDDVLTKVE